MKHPRKKFCPGTEYEHRVHFVIGDLYRCRTCGRIHKTTRRHQVRGPRTASYDKTMESLWAFAMEER